MCSFLALKIPKGDVDLDYINYFNQFRGPDCTNIHEDNGWLFAHNLLSITGEFTTQPFVDDGIVCFETEVTVEEIHAFELEMDGLYIGWD